ncbi:MAG: tsaB [Xanthomonadaceae bacterium]|nr:tsaB [Xanthomonadaceae bacterium]
MKLLAFETSTEACSVALSIDGAIIERFEIAPRRHAELSLPWAGQLLADAGIARSQLDAIAVGRGPGAFTGVRLAIALAQGIALALDRPVVAVSTLAALALRATGDRTIAAIDARMGEIYIGTFQRIGDELHAASAEEVLRPELASLPDSGMWSGVGTGFSAGESALVKRLQGQLQSVDVHALPHAADVARLAVVAFARGEATTAEKLEPAYLRHNVALTLEQQKAIRALR